MYHKDRSYKISFTLAIVFHISLAILLCLKITSVTKQPTSQTSPNIINAFSVNQSNIEKTTKAPTTTTNPPAITQPQQKTIKPTPKTETAEVKQPPQPIDHKVEQQKQEKLQQHKDLEKTLKQQMQIEQNRELKTLKKETTIKKHAQEKEMLQDAFTTELSKESKHLQKVDKQLKTTDSKSENEKESTNASTATNNATTNTQTTQNQGEIDKYKALIVQAIAQEWIIPDDIDKNTSCKLLINLGPGGVVLRVQVLQPSSNPLLDRSAQNAVWKASPLPIPKENSLLDNFRSIQLTVRPEEIISQ